MPEPDLTILVCKTKGAFLLRPDKDNRHRSIDGPFCDGWPISHMVGDPETGVMWAGDNGET
ncbi:hypothetical protein [Litoreibacter roseus]|uniref:Uncharacterized protein n=1 Tax=Litoreibacter roseus TaxID=2601869 RepID=A0A6N6JIU6_9RHOB|nr:hypothetical protein [Litoreibacter roseus]GFE65112.1 hypothetical protein KIN_21860 [Litoreibacter roseus]